MYIFTGKGSIVAEYLLSAINKKVKENVVLFDNHYPSYTLDLVTNIPSISKAIKENNLSEVIDIIQQKITFFGKKL